jgi:hypothetical protein
MGKILKVLLAMKFPSIDIFFSPPSFALSKMEVIKKPLRTKNKSTPNFGLGIRPLKTRAPIVPRWSGTPQWPKRTTVTANALSVSSPFIYFTDYQI